MNKQGTHPGCYAYKPCPGCGACKCRYVTSEFCVCHQCFAYLHQKDGVMLLVEEEAFSRFSPSIQADIAAGV